MKKFFIMALMAVAVTTSSFASGTNITNSEAFKSFTNEFKNVTNVNWTKGENYIKASFILNGTKTEAFYNQEGELIAKSNEVVLEALPTSAKRTIAKSYSAHTVKEAIIYEGSEETAYYISLENEKETVILKIGADEFVTVFQKTCK